MDLEVSPCLKINNREIPYTEMVKIPAKDKSFLLYGEKKITFGQDFWVAQYPVTQQLYEEVMGHNPSIFKGKYRPVENVSWLDAQKFIEELNKNQKDKNKPPFRLGSEAMWKYAAMAEGTDWKAFAGGSVLDEVGFYTQNSGEETMPVGLKEPNARGLFDMSGNVWEWCEDIWDQTGNAIPENGLAYGSGDKDIRVVAGGSWDFITDSGQLSDRNGGYDSSRGDNLGFRIFRY